MTNQWGGRYHYLRLELCSASRNFIEYVANGVLDQIGLEGSTRSRSLGRYHYLSYLGNQAIRLGEWIYESSDDLCLTRKRDVWERARNDAS